MARATRKMPYHVIFLSTLFLIIGFTFLSVTLLYRSQKDRYWVEHRRKMEIELTGVSAAMNQMESSQRGYLLSHDHQIQRSYLLAKNDVAYHIRQAYAITMDVWSQVKSLNRLQNQVLERQTLLEQLIIADSLPEPAKSIQIKRLVIRGHEVMQGINITIERMIRYEQRLYLDRTASITSVESISVILIGCFGILTAAISVLGYLRLLKENAERDIAEKARIQSAEYLRQSEMRYRNLHEASQDAIMIADSTGTILSWNKSAQNIFGYTPQQAYYCGLAEILPAYAEIAREATPQLLRGEDIPRFETIGKSRKGREIPVELSFSTWVIKGETFTGITARDITERRKTLDKLDHAIRELQRSNEDLEQFAYVASHDMQEPLRKIQAFSDRFMSSYDDIESIPGKEYLLRMRNAAERMQVLIQDLLSFSRLTRDKQKQKNVDLNAILAQVKEDLQLKIEETSAEIRNDLLPVLSRANPAQMQQLFMNLLTNALKFKKESENSKISITYTLIRPGGNPFTELRIHDKQSYHLIEVHDHGIGFDDKYLEKIFTIFQRLHGRSEYEGTGIGLAVCQKICKNHKGYLTAHGEPGVGATFSILLPVKDDSESPI